MNNALLFALFEVDTATMGLREWVIYGSLVFIALALLVTLIVLFVAIARVNRAIKEALIAAETRAEEELALAEARAREQEAAAQESEDNHEIRPNVGPDEDPRPDPEVLAMEEIAPSVPADDIPPVVPVTIPERESMTLLDKSFMARLAQADEELKGFYSDLKNYILSYHYVRSRVSWGHDNFNKGRTRICSLQLKGKSLFLYVALDPKAYDSKYHQEDVAHLAKYEETPLRLKIRTKRALNYAKFFIDEVMARLEIEQGKVKRSDYTVPYRTDKELITIGEIKVREVPTPEFWNMEAAEILENSPALPEVEVSLDDFDEKY